MRKKNSKIKISVVILALIIGLFIGILVIPALKDRYWPKAPVNTPEDVNLSVEPQRVATTEELLDEANWIEYKDNEFGFSFKYPKGFMTNVLNEPNQTINMYNGITFGRRKMTEGTLYQKDLEDLGYIIAVRVDRAASFENLVKETELYKEREGYAKKSIEIDGEKAVRFEGVGLDSYQTRVLIDNNNLVYSITLSRYITEGPLIDEGEAIFERMLQSVQF